MYQLPGSSIPVTVPNLFSLFSELFSPPLKEHWTRSEDRWSHSQGKRNRCYGTATTAGKQRVEHRRGWWGGGAQGDRFRSLVPLWFKRTRWTPGTDRSRSGTAPVGGWRVSSIIQCNLRCDFLLFFSFFFKFLLSFAIWDYLISLLLCSRTHRSVHHVGLAVPQSLHGVEDVHHALSLGHLAHNAAGAEHSAAAASVPVAHTRTAQNNQWVEGKELKAQFIALTVGFWTNDHFLSVCFVSYNWWWSENMTHVNKYLDLIWLLLLWTYFPSSGQRFGAADFNKRFLFKG